MNNARFLVSFSVQNQQKTDFFKLFKEREPQRKLGFPVKSIFIVKIAVYVASSIVIYHFKNIVY